METIIENYNKYSGKTTAGIIILAIGGLLLINQLSLFFYTRLAFQLAYVGNCLRALHRWQIQFPETSIDLDHCHRSRPIVN